MSGGYNWRNDYTEYDYIQQFYEYDYVFKMPTQVTAEYIKMVARVRADSTYNLYIPIISREIGYSPWNNNRILYGLYQNGSNLVIYDVSGASSSHQFTPNQWIDLEFTYTETAAIIKINGTEIANESLSLNQPTDCGAAWTLFGKPDLIVSGATNPTTQNPWNGKMQKVRIYNPSTNALLADLRPVKRNSDQQAGMFDIVNDTFCLPTGEYGEAANTFTVGNLS